MEFIGSLLFLQYSAAESYTKSISSDSQSQATSF